MARRIEPDQPAGPRPARRRGVSLMEVMFAIGVVTVGLLGVIALLPLAAQQVRKTVITDRAAVIGLSAVDEMDMRGFEPGDCSADGLVDRLDFALMATCLLGPGQGVSSDECACFDLDQDNEVTIADFAQFQKTFSGA